MDYGFAPGDIPQDGRARNFFVRRAHTKLVSVKFLVTLRGFAAHLLSSVSVTRPIHDALLGAHANCGGWIFIPITADPVFDPAHDYHWFERLGYSWFADFFADYTWSHSANKKGLQT